MKKQRKVFTLRVTENELFAITSAVNERLHGDPFGSLTTVEKAALHGVIRKADQSISDHYREAYKARTRG
jgi:hypothetical protein